jgi:DNA-binding Lrp family transcriptional regulator
VVDAPKGDAQMVTAFILLNAQRDHIAKAAQEILALPGITEVYSVAGPYDLVAVVRVSENEQLAKLVTEDLIAVKGITATSTLIAFRQYSRFDLERMFGLGS